MQPSTCALGIAGPTAVSLRGDGVQLLVGEALESLEKCHPGGTPDGWCGRTGLALGVLLLERTTSRSSLTLTGEKSERTLGGAQIEKSKHAASCRTASIAQLRHEHVRQRDVEARTDAHLGLEPATAYQMSTCNSD